MQRHVELINHAVSVLTASPNVQRVYLFGSCARGDESWSSDVDLLVVVDDSIVDTDIRLLSMSCIPDDSRTPELDIAVYRESTLATDTFFLQQARQDWRLLYENLL